VTELPLPVRTSFYLLMGWIGCVTYFELVRHLSHRKVGPIWQGGLLYTVGAVFNLCGWPVFAPGVFDAHDLFHLFVIAGSLCHYHFMLSTLVPHRGPGLVIPDRSTPAGKAEAEHVHGQYPQRR
jgi:hemolysin III